MARTGHQSRLCTFALTCALATFAICDRPCLIAAAGESGLSQIAALTPQQFQEIEEMASKGDRVSEAILAIAYERGIHVAKNDAESARWYRRLAETGSVNAQNRMGIFCQEGRGVPQSYSEAAEWFHKAATMGDEAAQANLATLYLKGLGVPQSYDEAAKWYEVSARQGNPHSPEQPGLSVLQGTGSGTGQGAGSVLVPASGHAGRRTGRSKPGTAI